MKVLSALFLFVVLLPAPSRAGPAEYVVRMESSEAEAIEIDARFALESDVIGMIVHSSPELTNGEADLVVGLAVRDESGESMEVEPLGSGDWRVLGGSSGQNVRVSYQVRLEHDRYNWGPGIDEVAYRNDDGLFFSGFALFVLPGMEMSDGALVRFELPDGWKASLPWPVDGESNRALVPDAESLVRNCLFLGTHLEEVVQLGEFTFTMAIGGALKQERQLFIDAMEPILPAALELFGGMPGGARYLVVLNSGNRADGGAFVSSYSMLLKGTVNQASGVIWAHGIAHELIHFWNGHVLVPASAHHEEWLREGFTDYLTIILRSRLGMEPREQTYRKMEGCMRRYLLSKMLLGVTDNLREAGREKHRNRMFVYGGGTLVAFALDVRIRQATRNQRGLDDFMRTLYEEFGKPGLRYEYSDVVRVATEVSGEDQSDFFDRYVSGTDLLDVAPYVEAIGLQLDTMIDEFYLSERPDARGLAAEMAQSIFGVSRP